MKKSILVSTLFGVFLVSAGIWNKPEASNKPVTVTEKSTLKDLAKDLADLNQVVIKTSSDDRQDSLKYFSYKIRKGDKLVRIARRFNTNIKDLMEVNKGNKNIRNENLLLAGGEISIPSVYSAKETIKLLVAQKEENEKLLRKVNELQKDNKYLEIIRRNYSIALIFTMFLTLIMVFVHHGKINALAEAEKRKNDLEAKLVSTETRLENVELELKGALKASAGFFEDLMAFQNCAPGKRYSFTSRENELNQTAYEVVESHIGANCKPVVVKIKCLKCGALDVKPENSNMNSHYWKHIKDEIDHA